MSLHGESSALDDWLDAFKVDAGESSERVLTRVLRDVDGEFFAALADEQEHGGEEGIYAIRDKALDYFRTVLATEPIIGQGHVETVKLVLALTVQSEKNEKYVQRIQKLPRAEQEELMQMIQAATSINFQEKFSIQARSLQTSAILRKHCQDGCLSILDSQDEDTLTTEHQELLAAYAELQRKYDHATSKDSDGPSSDNLAIETVNSYKAEIDRLQSEINTTADELAAAEADAILQNSKITALEASLQTALKQAGEAEKIKDQLDEYKHAADKLARAENVIEKYKRKLEESADLRRSLKSLEEENANLVDQNARLEEGKDQASAFKPAVDTYKVQLAALEATVDSSRAEIENLNSQLAQTLERLEVAEQERSRDAEAVQVYEQRLKEIESSTPTSHAPKVLNSNGKDDDTDDDSDDLGVNDSFSNTTASLTALRLQVKRLERQLRDAQTSSADASKVIVLESLLEDSERMRAKYEADYLAKHRETLRLESVLEEIRSASPNADSKASVFMSFYNAETYSPQIAMALRQRLNETTDQLSKLQISHLEAESQLERLRRDHIVAQSNLNLVNKDQLEIIEGLRADVSKEKEGLEKEVQMLKERLESANGQSRMHQSQINQLLVDKIDLQSDGIDQRQKMIEREQSFSALKASFKSKDLSQADQDHLRMLSESIVAKEEEISALTGKLEKARQFIRQQDSLARQKYGSSVQDSPELTRKLQETLTELEATKKTLEESESRHQVEQQAMIRAWQQLAYDHLRQNTNNKQDGVQSWLGQQAQRSNLLSR